MALFAYLTDSSGPQWLDLALLPVLGLAWILLALIWPGLLLRPLMWLAAHTIYRLKVIGREHIPRTGPALLLCNHVSYIDWLLLWAASPRPVRFIAWAGWGKYPLLGWFLRVTRSIPIDNVGPKGIVKALRTASEALDAGEVVGIFPEARLTRNGNMLGFQRGFERILKQAKGPVPVVPVCISQLWGSIFSYRDGRVVWKWPSKVPYPVSVRFGPVLPSTVTAPEVRQQIQELSADESIAVTNRGLPVHRQFVRTAAKYRLMFRSCMYDTTHHPARVFTYGKSLTAAICMARWLRGRIDAEEKNVALWLPTSAGGAFANIALSFLGKTTVNLNYTAGKEATRSAIQQTGVKHIITSKRFLARVTLEAVEGVEIIHLEDALEGIGKWAQRRTFLMVLLLPGWILDRVVLGMIGPGHRMDDLATIIFSSGSTGEPKGVMLSHRNVAANINSIIQHIDLVPDDKLLGSLPFFHSFGYTIVLWTPLQMGASTIYHADPRQAKEIGELARTWQATALVSTATFLRFYLRRCQPEDFKSLRILVCGAEKLPPSLAKEFETRFGILPLEGYGVTETSPVISVGVPDKDVHGVKQVGHKMGGPGHPIPGVACRAIDPETRAPLPIGSEGLLECKGANVMVGYYQRPDLTAKVMHDGWYITGDMGKLDEDGFLTITGRLSRFAKIGGEMVPLEKLEDEMLQALGTNDRVIAVAAVPDEKRGERLIVLHLANLPLSLEGLTAKLGERGLPNLWIPSERDFFEVPELPILASGKLDLMRVKELATAKAGGGK